MARMVVIQAAGMLQITLNTRGGSILNPKTIADVENIADVLRKANLRVTAVGPLPDRIGMHSKRSRTGP